MRRKVKESKEKSKQAPNQASPKQQMNFRYEAHAVQIDLNGNLLPLSGLRGASKESRNAYFKARSFAIHLLKQGEKIYFNPDIDVLYFGDLSCVFSHHLRQRLRWPTPFLNGLHNAKKIAFDDIPDEQRYSDLAEDVVDLFKINIITMKSAWMDVGQGYKYDEEWVAAFREEEKRLTMEMKNIRASGALGRVNGAKMPAGVTPLRMPLTAAQLA
jgi:hypothetical protein